MKKNKNNKGVFITNNCIECTKPYPIKINNFQEWYCPDTGYSFDPIHYDPRTITICPFFRPINEKYISKCKEYLKDQEKISKEKNRSLSLTERTLYDFLRYIKSPIAILSLPSKYIGAIGKLNSAGIVELYWSHIKKKNNSYDEIIKIKMIKLKKADK
uniref:Uncharacterized protein n=1 Tax=viral metagenome TaxID=1070528 RepID=A0A6H1ZLR5_9ZZZZ